MAVVIPTLSSKKMYIALLMSLTLFFAACSEDGESIELNVFESTAVKVVKSGKIGACPSATLGEMASAFLSSPK